MKQSFLDLKSKVIDKGFCTSCGACKGVCPVKAIEYQDKENSCIPCLKDNCIECGMCVASCVASGFDVKKNLKKQQELYGQKEKDENESFFLCHSKDVMIWQGGTSGGFVTATLLYALRKSIVEAVVVIGNDTEKPWLPKVILTESEEEVVEAMQSKYCVVPTLEILRDISSYNKKVAMVMLPCQAQTFMNIRARNPSMYKNVVFTVGLMCGNSLPFKATEDVLHQIGIKDVTRIKRLRYRDGFWHGEMHVILDDNTEFSVPEIRYMRYMADYYRKDRCKVCIDGDAMFTDFSSGDGWLLGKKQDGVYGWSIVHIHTKTGEDLYQRMVNDGVLESVSISKEDATSQKKLYCRYYSTLPRIENRKRQGIFVPKYIGLDVPESITGKKNLIKKRMVDIVSNVLFSEKVRKLILPIPLQIKTRILELIMKLWFREK